MRYLSTFGVILVGLVAPAQAAPLPACQANQLSLSLDDEDGAFDGMSHSGTLMVIRNTGLGACALPALPSVSFLDRAARVVDMARRAPPGMHPGPVVRPIELPTGGMAKAALRWVSGDVYDGHHCVAPTTLRVTVGSGVLSQAVTLQACGPPDKPVPFEQAWLAPDGQP